ncbi:Hypp7339 [Branchiostoma lanceolatum]|uniref:Hypp7339 protein n=1 Tax=Branchiostoma lanceolatum TaxID=7740 RepID=A0A8K0EAY6_BRALA|nr:Hypp7339 [Branchiostoma lanceolatum]
MLPILTFRYSGFPHKPWDPLLERFARRHPYPAMKTPYMPVLECHTEITFRTGYQNTLSELYLQVLLQKNGTIVPKRRRCICGSCNHRISFACRVRIVALNK